MPTKVIVLFAGLFLALGMACSGGAPQGSREEQVDALFAEFDSPDSPGCALGVIQDGVFLYRQGYGMANLDYSVPIDSKSVFYIASTSKQFAATGLALLVLRGELSLDDDIRTGSFRVRFQRGLRGEVTGYLLDAGRVRKLQFVRRD